MNNGYLWICVGVIALVTALTRFLPFIIFGKNRKTPEFVKRLGTILPFAIMGMLVVYCLKDMSFTSGMDGFLPEIISVGVVVISYILSRNTLVGIAVGTASYMVLVQLVF